MAVLEFPKVRDWLYVLIVVIISAGILGPSLNNSFINWDDPLYITQNTAIEGLTAAKLKKIFSIK